MKTLELPNINWEKLGGLLPVIIQHQDSAEVLMLGYMNQEALKKTCEGHEVIFFSRTKQGLWKKGETSGQILRVRQMFKDCDEDALLILVGLEGPCCHLNRISCFNYSPRFSVLNRLECLIKSRHKERPLGHYTTSLFDQGTKRIAQKVGEEGVELALAAMAADEDEIINEAADLFYHALVLLVAMGVSFEQVLKMLEARL